MRLTSSLLGLILAGLTVAGCSTGGGTPHITIPPSTPASAPMAAPAAVPADITIPKLNAHSTLIPLGLNTDPKLGPVGSIQIPSVKTPLQAGFYARGGVRPGQPGAPLVVVAHVNGDQKQGLFAHLGQLKPGDAATVKLTDGTVLTFRVAATESDPKTAFPGDKVFGAQDHATLRLVTCGGSFDQTAHSYRSNIIVFADKV